MSKFISNSFINMSEVTDWLNEIQPLHWQIIYADGMAYYYQIIAEIVS
jgi:hypothetical protein